MCHKVIRGLRVALSLAVFAVAGSPQGGLDLVLEQIKTMGPRQWLGVVASSFIPDALASRPLADGLARLLPGRTVGPAGRETLDIA